MTMMMMPMMMFAHGWLHGSSCYRFPIPLACLPMLIVELLAWQRTAKDQGGETVAVAVPELSRARAFGPEPSQRVE